MVNCALQMLWVSFISFGSFMLIVKHGFVAEMGQESRAVMEWFGMSSCIGGMVWETLCNARGLLTFCFILRIPFLLPFSCVFCLLPMNFSCIFDQMDMDNRINSLHGQVRRLRNICFYLFCKFFFSFLSFYYMSFREILKSNKLW